MGMSSGWGEKIPAAAYACADESVRAEGRQGARSAEGCVQAYWHCRGKEGRTRVHACAPSCTIKEEGPVSPAVLATASRWGTTRGSTPQADGDAASAVVKRAAPARHENRSVKSTLQIIRREKMSSSPTQSICQRESRAIPGRGRDRDSDASQFWEGLRFRTLTTSRRPRESDPAHAPKTSGKSRPGATLTTG
jgi:hypothetical protein